MSLFYIVGSAPSLNNITEEEWKKIEDNFNMGLGFAMWSHKKFKFYLTYEGEETNKLVIDSMTIDGYKDTYLLMAPRRPRSFNYALDKGFKVIPINVYCSYFLPSRQPWYVDEPKPPHPFKECRAKTFQEDLFRYRGSLSAAVNACLILGATEIRLVGVDLSSQIDFWEDTDKWAKSDIEKKVMMHEIQFKRQNMNNRSLKYSDIHATAIPYKLERWGNRPLRGMPDILEWMDKELREEGHKGIYTTNKDSLLFKQNKLQYKTILED